MSVSSVRKREVEASPYGDVHVKEPACLPPGEQPSPWRRLPSRSVLCGCVSDSLLDPVFTPFVLSDLKSGEDCQSQIGFHPRSKWVTTQKQGTLRAAAAPSGHLPRCHGLWSSTACGSQVGVLSPDPLCLKDERGSFPTTRHPNPKRDGSGRSWGSFFLMLTSKSL